MREPEEGLHGSTGESPEPRRPPDTSWGVGPWPVHDPLPARGWSARLTALCRRSLRVITLHPVRAASR